MRGRINRAHQTRHFAPAHVGDVGGGRRHGHGHARRVGASGEEDRAARSRARQDHRDQRADQGIGLGLRRHLGAGRGYAVVEGGRLPAVHRHSQQQAHEIHAGAGGHRRPRADQPRQRAHPRSAEPAALVRARQQARHPARARRQPHRAGEQLSGAAAQPAERRHRQVRRRHLLHRSLEQPGGARAVGPDLLGRLPAHARSRHAQPADRQFRISQRARLLGRRASALRQRFHGAATSARSRCCPTARSPSNPTGCSPTCAAASRACPTA